jgi:hypothetical protein
MQQKHRRAARRLVTCLEDMHVQAVDPGKHAGADAVRKHRQGKWLHAPSLRDASGEGQPQSRKLRPGQTIGAHTVVIRN